MTTTMKAAQEFNAWWQARTGKDEHPAAGCSSQEVWIEPDALHVLVVYARSMQALAEIRRRTILELRGKKP